MTALTGKLTGLFGKVKEVEQEVPPMEDPGKDYRSASGLPIVPAFDGFRALAIMGVVLLHLITIEGYATDSTFESALVWGFLGRAVEVLFVVSGFVVFLPTAARDGEFGPIGPYALRRAARLAPAYWLALAVTIVLAFVLPNFADPTWIGGIGHFLFLQEPLLWLDQGLEPGFLVNTPLWTLSVEIGFYVVLPFIACWYARHPFLGLAIAAAITVAWHSFIWRLPWAAESLDFDMGPHLVFGGVNQLPAWALSFASGMTAAWLYMKLMKRGRPPGSDSQRALVAVVVVLAFIGLSIWTGLEAVSRYALLSPAYESPLMAAAFSLVLGAAMLAICLAPQWLQWPFANQRVRKLGDISYGIYLSHYVLMVIAINVLGFELVERFSNLLELSLFVIPLSVLYGYLSARFVEQPIRRWAHRFGARAQSGQTPRESA